MECWSNACRCFSILHHSTTPLLQFCGLHYSTTPLIQLPVSLPRAYPLLGLCCGYALVILFTPVRTSLRDGFRCILRFPRICITFVVFGIAYSVFHFATLSPIQSAAEFDLAQLISLPTWTWPRLAEVWRQLPLPILENVAGIFDNATTTYPLSVFAAILIIANWRGLH